MSSPGPASPLVLSLRGVSKAFGAVQALRDVSVDCRAGEIHALVGENGSGKSTLLGIASGFVHPDKGAVEIGGQRRRRGSPAEARKLGLGIAYQTLLARPRPVGRREPLPRRAHGRETEVRTHGGVGGGEARGVQARRPGDRGRRVTVARRPAAPRGRQGPARPAEGACSSTSRRPRSGQRRSSGFTRSCSSKAGQASGSSTSATACRRCSESPTGSPCFATASARAPTRPPTCRRRRWSPS